MAQYKSRGGALPGPAGIYLARGLALTGLPNDPSMSWWFDDFTGIDSAQAAPWTQFNAGSGARLTAVAGTAGGVVRISTGATGASISSASTTAGAVQSEATTKWYAAQRFRVITAIDAVTFAIAGLVNFANTKTLAVGVIGALNAVNFIAQYDGNFAGSSLNLGVPIDTAFHVFEMYCLGDSVIRARIDGGAEVSAVQSAAPTDSLFQNFQVRNQGTAANRALEMDWFLSMTARV